MIAHPSDASVLAPPESAAVASTPVLTPSSHSTNRTLTESQVSNIVTMLASGQYSLREISRTVGCSLATVRHYAAKNKGLATKRPVAEIMSERVCELNQFALDKAGEALKRLKPKAWDECGVAGLSKVVERHSQVLLEQSERERLRNAPPPVYRPNPIFALFLKAVEPASPPVIPSEVAGQIVDAVEVNA